MIFFDQHDAELTARGRQVLDDFVTIANAHSIQSVGLTAQVDDTEHANGDGDLRSRRIDSVARYLIDHGFTKINGAWRSIYLKIYGLSHGILPVVEAKPDPYNRFVHLEIVGGFIADPTLARRKLLCRGWLLQHCIDAQPPAPAKLCKAGIDFLILGDDIGPDLDWRSKFAP